MIDWQVIQGDCLEVMQRLIDEGVKFDCVIMDPPYNINKDVWDAISDYENWLILVFKKLQTLLKDNGSLYWFHSEMPIIADVMQKLKEQTNFIFRQFIVWNKRFENSVNKGYLDGYVAVDNLRNYQQMAEYILYYTFQDETGLSKVLPHCIYPIRDYIRSEILRAKGTINLKEINTILGTATNGGGVASAALSLDKSHPVMITKEHYETLRKWLNNGHIEYLRQEYEDLRQEYEDLRQEYEDLRQEYEDLRYIFNNQKSHHSVWNYEIENKIGHLTPKPVLLLQNILRHSTNVNQMILDPFGGSGSTGVACAIENRNFIGIEIDPHYCKIARARITRACGQYAEIPKLLRQEKELPLFSEVCQ